MNFVTAQNAAKAPPAASNVFIDAPSLRVVIYLAQAVLDFFAIIAAFVVADRAYHGEFQASPELLSGVFVAVLYSIFAAHTGAFSHEALISRRVSIYRSLKALATAFTMLLVLAFSFKQGAELSRVIFFAGSGIAAALLVAGRLAMVNFVHAKFGGSLFSHVLIIDGAPVDAPSDYHVIDANAAGIAPNISDPMMLHLLGCTLRGADRVVVSCPPERRAAWAGMLKGSNLQGELLVPEIDSLQPINNYCFAGTSTVPVACGPLGMHHRIQKRLLDIALAVPILLFLMPLFIAVAIAIRIEDSGPVLFVQTRMGRGNRLFRMYKFRSMRTDLCDHRGDRSASRDDDRITRIGRFIRATSIDELPQLINVLLGEMSLVGPRPHALGSLAGGRLFWEVDSRYWHRHACKPGITGLAQIRGFRGATHAHTDLEDRLHADLEYLSGWSLWRDIGILLATFRVVRHENAF